jgi:NADH-quinone oxidoreductase subunit J
LVGVSAIFILSGADFIGVAQILVYIGGVMVLLLFGIMLTRREQSEQYPQSKSQHIFKAILIAVFVSAILVWLQSTLIKQSNLLPNQANELPSIEIIGELLLGRNLIMFEIAGFLLTVALIGASLIAASSQETNN